LEGWIEIVAAKIEIAEGEEGFTSWIIALPNDIEHMATHALRKIHREAVGISIQYGIARQGKQLEVGPFKRLCGVVCIFRDINFKAARRVWDGGGEAGVVGTGLDLCGWPVDTRQVEPGIFRAARAGELTIGNEVAVIALRNEATDLMPIVKGLRSGNGNRSLAGITRRRHRILKEYLMHAADRVAHGAMGEAGDTRDKKEQCCEKGIHKTNEG
jgi:hypothetical protein